MQADQRAEQGGLAGAVAAHQRGDRPGVQGEVDAAQGRDRAAPDHQPGGGGERCAGGGGGRGGGRPVAVQPGAQPGRPAAGVADGERQRVPAGQPAEPDHRRVDR